MIESFIKYDKLCCRPRKQLKGENVEVPLFGARAKFDKRPLDKAERRIRIADWSVGTFLSAAASLQDYLEWQLF
jgi:hypothetical protein